jgi:hypothetical protein
MNRYQALKFINSRVQVYIINMFNKFPLFLWNPKHDHVHQNQDIAGIKTMKGNMAIKSTLTY